MRNPFIYLLVLVALGLSFPRALAQSPNQVAGTADSLRLDLAATEKLFQERNLPLLAEKFNIEAAKGALIQARLFENPVLSLEQNIYNPGSGRYFEANRNGQNIVQLQQLFYLAGKRNKRIRVEQLNAQLTEFAYYDLLRTLRHELRSSFLRLHFLLQEHQIYQEKSQSVRQLVNALEGQYQKGNVALKEVTRLRALLFSLENQKLDLLTQINQEQADLRLLTGAAPTAFVVPVLDEAKLEAADPDRLTLDHLLQEAQENRYDLKVAVTQVRQQEASLRLQKSLAVPDISIGGVYDRAGSFVQNYTGLTVQVPLAIFNRNQGNIKIAESGLGQSQVLADQQQRQVETEVSQALQNARNAESLYRSFDQGFTTDFNRLIDGVTQSFAKRNISLIEFLDYYETYTETMTQLLTLRSNRLRALEDLNFTVGKPVVVF
jgi:cobalt-zinc-cadmium efflux system outer membrane protein